MSAPTKAQVEALGWLRAHGGDGVFDRHQVLFAAGETAPVRRGTWNALHDLGLVELYQNKRRCRLTDAGREAAR